MPAGTRDDGSTTAADPDALGVLFHRLNNQLGVILAHAELLEAKASDEQSRSRAAQVVSGALGAMTTVKEIRQNLERQGG